MTETTGIVQKIKNPVKCNLKRLSVIYLLLVANFIPIEKNMLRAKVKDLLGKWRPKRCNQIPCQLQRKLSTEIATSCTQLARLARNLW